MSYRCKYYMSLHVCIQRQPGTKTTIKLECLTKDISEIVYDTNDNSLQQLRITALMLQFLYCWHSEKRHHPAKEKISSQCGKKVNPHG